MNLRDIEQGLEQMSRLPGVDARMSIQAGRKPGESVLAVERKAGPFLYGDAGTDNLGSSSTGVYQDHFGIGLADLLGLNDRLDVGYQRSMSNSPLHLERGAAARRQLVGQLRAALGLLDVRAVRRQARLPVAAAGGARSDPDLGNDARRSSSRQDG